MAKYIRFELAGASMLDAGGRILDAGNALWVGGGAHCSRKLDSAWMLEIIRFK